MRAATATLFNPGYAMFVRAEPRAHGTGAAAARAVLLACAAPFIGLAFVVALPFAGLAALAWMGARILVERWARVARFARNVVLFAAAPFIGLAYALALPFVGFAMLVWMAVRREPAAG